MMGQRDFVKIRAAAREQGDYNLARAMQVELDRLGYVDPGTVETTAAVMPERAVLEKRRGRPPKPRCEHGRIPDRCLDCSDDLAA